MSPLQWLTKSPFGSVPVLSAHDQIPSLENPAVAAVMTWSINMFWKACRLTLVHQGILLHLKVNSNNPYGELFYKIEAPCWARNNISDTFDYWVPRNSRGFEGVIGTKEKEDELLALVEKALPRLLDGVSTGSQLWAQVVVEPSNGAGLPQVELVGDIFRRLMMRDLPALSEGDFDKVPRLDMSDLAGYCLRSGWMKDNVLPVLVRLRDGEGITEAVFKTIDVPDDYEDWNENEAQVTNVGKDLFWGELGLLTSLPPHPNVMTAPLALITISHAENDATTTKLVGWLQHEYREFVSPSAGTGTEAAAMRSLRFAYELCLGIQHLVKHGFYHSDLAVENCLWAGTPPNDRLMVIDLQPMENYHNKNGPDAPEVQGYWNVNVDSDGKVVYRRSEGDPVHCGDYIFDEWKPMPEALERLLVFNIGSIISILLNIRLVFSWVPPDEHLRRTHLREAPQVGADPVRDAWEALIPQAVRDLAEQCSSYDPRERPLLQDVISALEPYKNVNGA
ncbi:hypothetical protein CF327_g3363 [Tilletia walkeri]|nr:hypothetical protein CF327_g3363 [Tilletia walkeri]